MEILTVNSLDWILKWSDELLPNTNAGKIYYIPYIEYKNSLYRDNLFFSDKLAIQGLLDKLCIYLFNEVAFSNMLGLQNINIVLTDLDLKVPEDNAIEVNEAALYYNSRFTINYDNPIYDKVAIYFHNRKLLEG